MEALRLSGGEKIIHSSEIDLRVNAMADMYAERFAGKVLTVITLMNGAKVFSAQLCQALSDRGVLIRDENVRVQSMDGTENTGVVTIYGDHESTIKDCHVLVIEDIHDTGGTLSKLLPIYHGRGPASLSVACLLEKPTCHEVDIFRNMHGMEMDIDVTYGFVIDGVFVIGRGLDWKDKVAATSWYREYSSILVAERVVDLDRYRKIRVHMGSAALIENLDTETDVSKLPELWVPYDYEERYGLAA